MINYVGDVSRNDALLLRMLAERSSRILEFGCGASTQIFAAYRFGSVHSVDTDLTWIEKTKRNIAALGLLPVVFHRYDEFVPNGFYDMVFVDGANELRLPFALKVWRFLSVGGVLCFHDTRRTEPHGKADISDVQMVCAVLEKHSTEIDRVVMNQDNSNISIVTKRAPLLLEDYNLLEGRTEEQLGLL